MEPNIQPRVTRLQMHSTNIWQVLVRTWRKTDSLYTVARNINLSLSLLLRWVIQSWPLGTPSSLSCVLLLYPIAFQALPNFLASQTIPCLSYIFPTIALKPNVSWRSSGYFIICGYLENKIWTLHMIILLGCHCFQAPRVLLFPVLWPSFWKRYFLCFSVLRKI